MLIIIQLFALNVKMGIIYLLINLNAIFAITAGKIKLNLFDISTECKSSNNSN